MRVVQGWDNCSQRRAKPVPDKIYTCICIIIIRERADEPLIGSARSALQSRRIRNLCKGAIAIVSVETICAFEIFHEQIQPAVVVVIDPKTAPTAIHRRFDPSRMSDVFKRPIAKTSEEKVALFQRTLRGAYEN